MAADRYQWRAVCSSKMPSAKKEEKKTDLLTTGHLD
jgi:hypothetical protein